MMVSKVAVEIGITEGRIKVFENAYCNEQRTAKSRQGIWRSLLATMRWFSSSVFSPKAGYGRNQSPVRRPVWLCHCFPPPLDVPTFASRCLHVQATWETSISERRNYGREMASQFCLWFRLPRKPRVLWHATQICDMGDGFTSPPRKACCGFFRPKNPTASAGIVPAILGTRGQHANH